MDIYLHLPGIVGPSIDKAHKDWIEVTSVTWGVEGTRNPGRGGGGGGAGRATQHPLIVSTTTSIATPLLFEAVAKGTRFATAALEVVRATAGAADVVHRWEFEDVQVVMLDVAGAEPGFTDVFELTSARTRLTVSAQDPRGGAGTPVTEGWDFTAQRAW
ncbi:type VI secretion system tube protein Hcp [Microbacterium sp. 2FI]|uniref:Hcp family type VI secretion system effector n=1 Tax=Microbacterium sp. 2FI TaxID=2502193 RepID=UPI001485AB7C|nr:type VI secretion system tube protein Hcp [Microbacterium sp. 2FI]